MGYLNSETVKRHLKEEMVLHTVTKSPFVEPLNYSLAIRQGQSHCFMSFNRDLDQNGIIFFYCVDPATVH